MRRTEEPRTQSERNRMMQLTDYDDHRHCLFGVVSAFVGAADAPLSWRQRSYVTVCCWIRRTGHKSGNHWRTRSIWYHVLIILPNCRVLALCGRGVSGAVQDGILTSQDDHILRSFRQSSFGFYQTWILNIIYFLINGDYLYCCYTIAE